MYPDKKNETGERLDEIAEEIVSLASDVPGVDLGRVIRAVERVNGQHKDRIERALAGLLDLEQLKKPHRVREFAVAYWQGGQERIAQGVEFPARRDEQGKLLAPRIHVDDYGHPMGTVYQDMDALKKVLDDYNLIYRIAYLD